MFVGLFLVPWRVVRRLSVALLALAVAAVAVVSFVATCESPSGTAAAKAEVAFYGALPSGTRGVLATRADGSGLRLIAKASPLRWKEGLAGFVVSPDGRRVAYRLTNGLAVVSAKGGRSKFITHGFDLPLSWSPDGRWILLLRNGRTWYVVRSDGTEVRELPSTLTDGGCWPAWTPDSKAILGPNLGRLGLYGLDGHEITRLADTPCPYEASFSPDGKRVALALGNKDGQPQGIMIGRSDLTDLHWLIKQPADPHYSNDSPVWSPDGKQLAYNHFTTNYHEVRGAPRFSRIQVVTVSGRRVRKLATPPGYSDSLPAWTPGGRKIVFYRFKHGDGRGIYSALWIGEVSTGHQSELYGHRIGSFGIGGPTPMARRTSSR